ncbi:MAG: roadblock/LC7 domain-containing protein [candidate division Zixibacteria bacterium]|nr:roadblock/LC7 domain-containing protein [candidate division Zixibacteria bacterium]
MIDRSDIDERIAKCNKILDENPSSQIFAALAEAHRKKGELDKAFRICQNGLKVHPDYGSAHLVMAKVNMDKGLFDWAETELNKAIELDGATRATELLLSEIYIYKGEFNQACRILEKLHQNDPENDQIKRLLEIAKKIPLDQVHSEQSFHSASPSRQVQSQEQFSPTVTMAPPEPAPVVELSHKQMLQSLVGTPGVEGVLIINSDGLVIEAEWNVEGDTDLIGALAVETARYSTVQIRESGYGNLLSMMIETPQSLYYMAGVQGKLLSVVCTEKVNLGSLKLKLSGLISQLAAQ